MRTTITLILALLCASYLQSQELLSSGGDTFVSGDAAISFSLGEMAIETYSNTNQMTQGFHQPDDFGVHVYEQKSVEFNVYPNPSDGQLTLQLSSEHSLSRVLVLDMQGREVLHIQGQGFAQQVIDLSTLSGGSYLIQINVIGDTTPSEKLLIQIF